MQLSDWQKDRLRSYLRAYRMYGRDDGGRFYSWSSVSDAIWEYTGCRVPHEPLRQFVEGYRDKATGEWEYRGLTDERLEAVVQFLTHEEMGIMPDSELTEPPSVTRPPLQLIELFGIGSTAKRELNWDQLGGRYVTQWVDGAVVQSEFVLERLLEGEGLFKVTGSEEYYDIGIKAAIDELTHEDRERERWSIEKCAGWAILTPEDDLIVFLKDESSGWNRKVVTLGAVHDTEGKGPFCRLAMLDHQFPLIIKDAGIADDEMADRSIQRIADHVRIYERRR